TQPVPSHPNLRLRALSIERPEGPIPIWHLRQDDQENRPLVLYAHAHGGRYEIGKSEILEGRPALQQPPLGTALAEAGYNVVCWDARSFGARRSMKESVWTKAALWQGRAPWGLMLEDAEQVLSWALAEDGIDPHRTAAVGLSMGALLALWLTAIDPRIGVCVELCCLANIKDLVTTGDHDRHAPYFMVPGWLEHGDSLDLCRLVAPRPHLVCAGAKDLLTPAVSLASIDSQMAAHYEALGQAERWKMLVESEFGHQESPAHRANVRHFLDQFLRDAS
ncbi:MAG: alpha/beta hydrolase, partial [Pseudomonadota bacterium]